MALAAVDYRHKAGNDELWGFRLLTSDFWLLITPSIARLVLESIFDFARDEFAYLFLIKNWHHIAGFWINNIALTISESF